MENTDRVPDNVTLAQAYYDTSIISGALSEAQRAPGYCFYLPLQNHWFRVEVRGDACAMVGSNGQATGPSLKKFHSSEWPCVAGDQQFPRPPMVL